jgi:hypothetical protein
MSYAGTFPTEGEKPTRIPRDPSRNATTAKVPREQALPRKSGWPVFLCGVIAGIFAGLALFTSPVGRSSAVRKARGHLVHVEAWAQELMHHQVKH